MARKRSKVPGTPGVALQNGRGVLSLSDVMVTWVVSPERAARPTRRHVHERVGSLVPGAHGRCPMLISSRGG